MLIKIVGGVMFAVSAFYAIKILLNVIWAVGSIAFIGALMYFGWRLFSREQ